MSTIEYERLFIGGEWRVPLTAERITVRSATTENVVGSVPLASPGDIDAAVAAARSAFDDPTGWSTWSPADRAAVMRRFADALEQRGPETARRTSMQNGMPIWLAMDFEAASPPMLLRFYADMIENAEFSERRQGLLGRQVLVLREPIGVVGAIVPWNAPQGITFLKVAPALAAGCAIVLKPAPETVLDAFLMAEAAEAAGIPSGVINVVPGGADIGAYLVEHPGVDKVSFTGSSAAGKAIAQTCARLMRPATLELGGKSAAVLLDDVDVSDILEALYAATLLNNGQICWLGTRVLAPASRYDATVEALGEFARTLRVGDPLDPDTTVGPLVSERQRNRVENYIRLGEKEGGTIVSGGGRPTDRDKGWFVEPTVFSHISPKDTLAQEEIFGPVLTVIPYADEDDAIAIANDTEFGLGGSVWTDDPSRGAQFARRIRSGTVGVNGYANDPIAPFGGIKSSGMGRELGVEGLAAFQNIKSIYLDEPNA